MSSRYWRTEREKVSFGLELVERHVAGESFASLGREMGLSGARISELAHHAEMNRRAWQRRGLLAARDEDPFWRSRWVGLGVSRLPVDPENDRLVAEARIAESRGDIASAISALRQLGVTRRGLNRHLLELIARQHGKLIAEGEPHPIKALAAMVPVDKSTASRWVSAARARSLIS